MRTRTVVLVVVALLLALVLALKLLGHAQRPVQSSVAARPSAALVDTFFAWRDVHSFAEARAMLADAYRLRPDARILRAIEDVPVLTGAPRRTALARWDGSCWAVTCGPDSVGSLPAYPAYADARALLAAWARRSAPHTAAGAPRTPAPDVAVEPIAALAELDRAWTQGDRSAACFAAAGDALAWLAMATISDVTRRSDALAGRALAAAALAEAAGTPCERTHVLLAGAMGYAHEADALARGLRAEDPRRAWASGDLAALGAMAATRGAPAEARVLHLHALASRGRQQAWREALEREFPGDAPGRQAALSTGLALHRFEIDDVVAAATLVNVALELQGGSRLDTARVLLAFRTHEIPARMERLLLASAPRRGGPLLDADMVQDYARAQVYTTLTALGEFERSTRFDADAAHDFAPRLGAPGDGPAGEFARWYRDLVDARWPASDSSADLARDVVALRTLGAEQLELTYADAAPALESRLPMVTRALLRRMDTRPRDRAWLAWTAEVHGFLLGDRDGLLAASAAAGGAGGETSAMWLARLRGDERALVDHLGDPDVEPDAKLHMLSLLAGFETDPTLLHRCFAAASAANPDDERVVLAWALALDRRHQPDEARRVLEQWLDRDWNDRPELGIAAVSAALAREYRRAGMPERALATVGRDSTGKSGVVAEQVRALDALGDEARAMRAATAMAERYRGEPDPDMLLAELHLAHGRFPQAAEALMPTLDESGAWNGPFAGAFIDRFAGRPDAAMAAVRAMAHRFGARRSVLAGLAFAYEREGDPAMAFAIAQTSMRSGWLRAVDAVRAYELLARSRGERAALAWMDTLRLSPPAVRRLAVETAAAYGHPEPAWHDTSGASAPAGVTQDWNLLVRAPGAAVLPPHDPRRVALLRAVDAAGGGYYRTLARYVAEGGAPDSVLALATSPKRRVEVFFWAGLRASIEGREADAAAAWQLCRETDQHFDSEFMWSSRRLDDLLETLRPLRARR